jgi:hypothetical protein
MYKAILNSECKIALIVQIPVLLFALFLMFIDMAYELLVDITRVK